MYDTNLFQVAVVETSSFVKNHPEYLFLNIGTSTKFFLQDKFEEVFLHIHEDPNL